MFSLPFIVGGRLYGDRGDDLLLGEENTVVWARAAKGGFCALQGFPLANPTRRGSTFPTSPTQLNVCPSPSFSGLKPFHLAECSSQRGLLFMSPETETFSGTNLWILEQPGS